MGAKTENIRPMHCDFQATGKICRKKDEIISFQGNL